MTSHWPMSLRRSRQTARLRELFSQVEITSHQLIQPYFLYEGQTKETPLPTLAGQWAHTLSSLQREMERGLENGIHSALLFVVPKDKSEKDFSYDFDQDSIAKIKKNFGSDLVLFTDLCLCSNTHTGHCGVIGERGEIANSPSVDELVRKALAYAQAGADVISPSDMMDSRIKAMREALDQAQLHHILLMSYSTKFSSAFYGPFREAAHSAPSFGDRKSYQIDPRNVGDALRSSIRDVQEGADILMVKPAQTYLDVLYRLKELPETKHLPLAAYQVSGEYQSMHLMSEAGLMNFREAYLESLISLKRAGADLIITYGANEFKNLRKG